MDHFLRLPHLMQLEPWATSLSHFWHLQLFSRLPHLHWLPLGLLKSQLQHLQQSTLFPHLHCVPLGTYHQYAGLLPPPQRFMLLPLGLQPWQVVQAQLSSRLPQPPHCTPFLIPFLQFWQFHSIVYKRYIGHAYIKALKRTKRPTSSFQTTEPLATLCRLEIPVS